MNCFCCTEFWTHMDPLFIQNSAHTHKWCQSHDLSNSYPIYTDHSISPLFPYRSGPNFDPSLALVARHMFLETLCGDLCYNGDKYPFPSGDHWSTYLCLVSLPTGVQFHSINCPDDGVYYCCAMLCKAAETCAENGHKYPFSVIWSPVATSFCVLIG